MEQICSLESQSKLGNDLKQEQIKNDTKQDKKKLGQQIKKDKEIQLKKKKKTQEISQLQNLKNRTGQEITVESLIYSEVMKQKYNQNLIEEILKKQRFSQVKIDIQGPSEKNNNLFQQIQNNEEQQKQENNQKLFTKQSEQLLNQNKNYHTTCSQSHAKSMTKSSSNNKTDVQFSSLNNNNSNIISNSSNYNDSCQNGLFDSFNDNNIEQTDFKNEYTGDETINKGVDITNLNFKQMNEQIKQNERLNNQNQIVDQNKNKGDKSENIKQVCEQYQQYQLKEKKPCGFYLISNPQTESSKQFQNFDDELNTQNFTNKKINEKIIQKSNQSHFDQYCNILEYFNEKTKIDIQKLKSQMNFKQSQGKNKGKQKLENLKNGLQNFLNANEKKKQYKIKKIQNLPIKDLESIDKNTFYYLNDIKNKKKKV
ncbi:hypothetical protein PPERSA_09486 [Pseudocohnilembus persalinus]|uniref:Uncharacterized protein n=1 Tax=Pseudocohnilembus persalinus TaxID=266149 RepID=A0A0V0QR19_PSEPJ|nr:hypothetical protein PPERSA_09486 [Pseudocohnilembus persalinus]|eukprot:KRX04694.1 hypothetical protein PPERSA_09486 [Pseudocohnilembus persalinus]